MKFYAKRNKDAAKAYIDALISAGHMETPHLQKADFLLFDIERPKNYLEFRSFLKRRIGFGYPHVPYGDYFLYDGLCYKELPIQCRFVVAPGAKRALESIGYKSRVEVAGFTHCAVRPFTPTSGKRVLLVVPRLLNGGRYVCEDVNIGLRKVYDFLTEHVGDFEQITIQHTPEHYEKLELPIIKQFRYTVNDPRNEENPSKYMADLIEKHDLVFGIGTAAYMALALGKPTIMWGNDVTPRTLTNVAKHPEKYMDYFRYPLDFEKMIFEAIMETTQRESEAVTHWKMDNIGEPFDSGKFLQVVREYIQ